MRHLIVLSALLVTALSGWAGYREIATYVGLGPDVQSRYEALASGGVTPGLSTPSAKLVLGDCLDIPRDIHGLAQPTESRRTFAAACNDIADVVLRHSPALAQAHLVRLMHAGGAAETERFALTYSHARDTAPNIQWMAERRLALITSEAFLAPQGMRLQVANDVAVLLETQPGREALARQFVQKPYLQELIEQVTASSPVDQQQGFVQSVRRAAAQPSNPAVAPAT